jgi:hypothetical protein
MLLSFNQVHAETLSFERIDGAAYADPGDGTGADMQEGSASATYPGPYGVALADAFAVPGTVSATSAVPESSSSAMHITDPMGIPLSPGAGASATLRLLEGVNADPGGWLSATLSVAITEVNAAGGVGAARFGDVSLAYQGGVFFFSVAGVTIDAVPPGGVLNVSQYVQVDEDVVITTYAIPSATLGGAASGQMDCLAFGTVESDDLPGMEDTNNVELIVEGESPVNYPF